ncbi:MAG: hypothetical protein WC719_02645 [Patescibacteria group bacterium]|jgi:hypothetical protein
MKKIIFTSAILIICSLGVAFGQLRVSNNFGQTLKVTINNQQFTIMNSGVQAFSVASQAVFIKCETLDGMNKFSVTKAVPQNNLILINPNDGQNSQVVSLPSGQIKFVYKGSIHFKVISMIGKGTEFFGKDSIAYIPAPPRDKDLVLGVIIKEDGDAQFIWRYAEIRKRINPGETECRITDQDIKIMSEEKGPNEKDMKIVFRLDRDTDGYKIFSEPGSKNPISIGSGESSKSMKVPFGIFFIKVSVTGGDLINSTVFILVHTTDNMKAFTINKARLVKLLEKENDYTKW